MNEGYELEKLVFDLSRDKKWQLDISNKEIIDLIHGVGQNICVDYSERDWNNRLSDPKHQKIWVDIAIDYAWSLIHYAAQLAERLEMTEEEIMFGD